MTPYSGSFIINSSKQRMGFTLSLMLILSFSNSAAAQSSGTTLERVEEDWVALLAEPESATTSPQIMNFISPIQSTSGIFGLVQVNHRGAPDFSAGGLQVQGWVGSSLSSSVNATRTEVLSQNSDAVGYTVAMQKVSEGIRIELLNGRSRTWGRFATTPVSVTIPVNEPSLEDYSPDFSVANTTVNLGAHRIDLLYLTTTRHTYSDGVTVTDTTDRVIHRYQISVQDVSLTAYEANPEDYNIGITK